MPITRGRVTLSGVKPIQVQKPGYQNFYLYGAISMGRSSRPLASDFFSNETLSALRQRVQEKLRSYTDEAIAPLTGYQYLVDAANAQPS